MGSFLRKKDGKSYSNLDGMPLTIRVSIDGATKETYESLRRGGKWETICQNMEYLGNAKKHGQIQSLGIHFVMQRNNFREAEAPCGAGEKGGMRILFAFWPLPTGGRFQLRSIAEKMCLTPKMKNTRRRLLYCEEFAHRPKI